MNSSQPQKPDKNETNEPSESKKIAFKISAVWNKPFLPKSCLFWLGMFLLMIGIIYEAIWFYSFFSAYIKPGFGLIYDIVIVDFLLIILPGLIIARRGIKKNYKDKPNQEEISFKWWLLPLATGFIGGIISWAKQVDVNWRKAMNMLTIGFLVTYFWAIPLLVFNIPFKNILYKYKKEYKRIYKEINETNESPLEAKISTSRKKIRAYERLEVTYSITNNSDKPIEKERTSITVWVGLSDKGPAMQFADISQDIFPEETAKGDIYEVVNPAVIGKQQVFINVGRRAGVDVLTDEKIIEKVQIEISE